MLTFFPTPYEDELWYGIITRYHIRSGNACWKYTIQELFPETKGYPQHDHADHSVPIAGEHHITAGLCFAALSVSVSDALPASGKEAGVLTTVSGRRKYAAKISVHDQEERCGDAPPLLPKVHG